MAARHGSLYLGVDGGQSRTLAVIGAADGSILGSGLGGPANHIDEPGGVDRVRRSLSDAIERAAESAGIPDPHFAVACLGMTGLSADMDRVCRPAVPADRLLLAHDTRIALHSVTFGRPGVVVIAGTGSVAYGLNAEGRECSAGGWGYCLGDEGSGYWIAIRGLNACTRAADGRGPETGVLPRVLSALGTADLGAVHRLIYTRQIGRPEIAALAKVVSDAALAGDPVARRVMTRAGLELAAAALRVIARLDMAATVTLVGTVGGVFRAGKPVAGPFKRALRRSAPLAEAVPPRVNAAVAACLVALREDGRALDEQTIQAAQTSACCLTKDT